MRNEQTDHITIELKQLEKIYEHVKEAEAGQCSYSIWQGIKETKSVHNKSTWILHRIRKVRNWNVIAQNLS